MKVLILAPYPTAKAPNQRFRFEQYLPFLEKSGIRFDYRPFWNEEVWDIFYQPGHFRIKFLGLLQGIIRRKLMLVQLHKYEYVIIHREAMPVGPPILEFMIARIWKKKIIYDFDDAIWIKNYSEANKGIARWLKSHQKVGRICHYSYKVTTGNEYLATYAKRFNPNVTVIPTTIDTDSYHNRIKEVQKEGEFVIGWTGTHSTIAQLREIESELAELQKTIDFDLHFICNADPAFTLVNYQYKPWNYSTEIEDLLKFDIGIMPLRNTDWERGKCGFKALQYMALGIPVVASAVGVNCEIITDRKDGYLIPPDHPELWIARLKDLLQNNDLRQQLGTAGRQTVVQRYSVESNKEKYLRLFKNESEDTVHQVL